VHCNGILSSERLQTMPKARRTKLEAVTRGGRLEMQMRYRVKWRDTKEHPLVPEPCESADEAKERSRALLQKFGPACTIEIWNEDESWQVVSSAGIREWCGMAHEEI
jgi:hypothetical protein